MKFETRTLHTGFEIDKQTGASSVPIFQASTFHQEDWDGHQEFDYARSGNPTRQALEKIIAELEGARYGYAFASGMAAISGVLLTLPTGSHVVACEDIYGGTFRALTRVFSRLGIETTFVDASRIEQMEAAIRPDTKLLMLETPSNPTLKIIDLKKAADLAKQKGIVTVVDNTFMSPYLQRPHELGIDVVVHSGTKFLGGHSDVVAGLVTVNDPALAKEIYLIQNGFGGILGPQDCWLLMRGIKTLAVRMKESQQSATEIACYLAKHPRIRQVYYPGLEDHPDREIHFQQAKGPGAVLSFDLGNAEKVKTFVEHVQLPLFAVSLGAVESILSYPVRMSHASMPPQERKKRGISDGLLRLSVGLEDVNDLLKDIEQALEKI
ncbi:trans-sulfuration enzyme family protein [Effusibacillus dendaii]|uniref:cysteine-S-conjugate beta-lyase n=1 Tax=Effusibacillus dendaii TaxID=2743772 RepID=A0A7I8D5G6_9BACL|nr:aminotransferase class V-fold PLP-dependent enzyme [Effusibacillus dendaii]BCJ85354.1 cystathionine gamma-synthase [Effusibacillus dendaii]